MDIPPAWMWVCPDCAGGLDRLAAAVDDQSEYLMERELLCVHLAEEHAAELPSGWSSCVTSRTRPSTTWMTWCSRSPTWTTCTAAPAASGSATSTATNATGRGHVRSVPDETALRGRREELYDPEDHETAVRWRPRRRPAIANGRVEQGWTVSARYDEEPEQ